MHTVIVESPAKCRTINKYLGKDYNVLASFGHIRDLPSKNGSVRPEEDFAIDYEISAQSQKHVKAIADSVKQSDTLILATDPDREGEAISWHVLEALKKRKALKKGTEIKRVVFSSITKKAVLEAMENPRDVDMDLVNAQQARRALDYLVGFTLSPVLWRKLPGSRSAGRVQSVSLRLICERENEIEKFVSQEYWDIDALFQKENGKKFTARLTHLNGERLDKFALPDQKISEKTVKSLESKEYSVSSVEKKQSKRNPYPPFTTSSLQQEAARKLGFSSKRTMQVAQKLYEGMDIGGETAGLITYMRTDGVDVAPEAVHATRAMIEKTFGSNYVPKSPRMYKSKAKNAQEAHEAIRPTDISRKPDSVKAYLDKDQLKLYDLIWKRMMACQMESVVLDQVAAIINSSDGQAGLRAVGSTVRFDGFYRLYNEGKDDEPENEDEKTLPPLEGGEDLKLNEVKPEQHFTQPPPRYSEASLVKKMEELGIGRPSTYASIISILQDREYVRLDKRRFIPEPRGRIVTSFLESFFNKYVEYDFTADLEEELDDVSAGKSNWKDVLKKFWVDFSANIEKSSELRITEVLDHIQERLERAVFPGDGALEERRKCPTCGDGLLSLKVGKFGGFVGCSNYPECKQTRPFGSSAGDSQEEGATNEPVILGDDPENGEPVSLRKGPYGPYVQLGEGKKPKRSSLPKGLSPADVDLKKALALLSLPRLVGTHPETGEDIMANNGRYGPYIQLGRTFVSLKGEDDVLTVGINRAVALLADAGKKKGVEVLRELGKHPESGDLLAIYDGRYGPYVKHKKKNVSIPKGTDVDAVTLEEVVELLASKTTKKALKKAPKKAKAPRKKKS